MKLAYVPRECSTVHLVQSHLSILLWKEGIMTTASDDQVDERTTLLKRPKQEVWTSKTGVASLNKWLKWMGTAPFLASKPSLASHFFFKLNRTYDISSSSLCSLRHSGTGTDVTPTRKLTASLVSRSSSWISWKCLPPGQKSSFPCAMWWAHHFSILD